MDWYPLKLTAHIRAYPFGERLLAERLGKAQLPDGIVAESWEISDYRETTGTVVNGALRGRTLHQVVIDHPEELVGLHWRGPHFPLLETFLDASHMLPVHLHADDETARRVHREPNGKTEAWHILWAAPGATVLAGVRPGVGREELFSAFKQQDYDAVMPRYAVAAGDTVYVPGGIIHSFGPDTLIYEVQQTSDLLETVMPTDIYGRRYDEATWDRHITAALDELRTSYLPRPNPGLQWYSGVNRHSMGCAGPHFALERWELEAAHVEPAHPRRCMTLANISDAVALEYEHGVEVLERAESCILPAAIGGLRVVPRTRASLIVCYVPDLQVDIWEPLRARGFSDAQIQGLGAV